MTLELQSWLPQAEQLKLGQTRRVDHDCGGGRTLKVGHTEAGYNGWCFRCSDKGFKPHPQPSLAERIAALRKVQVEEDSVRQDPRPPMPAEWDPSDWPQEARVWLYKAGLSNQRIQDLGYYWNPRIKRVVMPVVSDGSVVYWQARSLEKGRPKYLNPEVDKPLYKLGEGDTLVLTEDMLSAARVSEVTEAWSILGTSLDDSKVSAIIKTNKPIRVWLDPDTAGRKGASKIMRLLRGYGIDTVNIKTDLDPKFYSKAEIQSILANRNGEP